MIAVPLIFGRLTAADYEDAVAAGSRRIDALRDKLTASKSRSSPAIITIPRNAPSPTRSAWNWNDGTVSKKRSNIPIGHRRRRKEGLPLLIEKFKTNLARRFGAEQQQRIIDASMDFKALASMPVSDYVDLYVI